MNAANQPPSGPHLDELYEVLRRTREQLDTGRIDGAEAWRRLLRVRDLLHGPRGLDCSAATFREYEALARAARACRRDAAAAARDDLFVRGMDWIDGRPARARGRWSWDTNNTRADA